MKIIIHERQRGLKFKNGRFLGVVGPGKYHVFGDKTIEVVSLDTPISSLTAPTRKLLENNSFREAVVAVEVGDIEAVLHFVNGNFYSFHRHGLEGVYAFFKDAGKHTFLRTDISLPEVDKELPRYLFERIPLVNYQKVEIGAYEKGRLYYDGHFVRLLEPGSYYFWRNDIKVAVTKSDTRRLGLDIAGQELLTRDKVTIRINFVLTYQIKDFVKIETELDDYREQLHVAAQLALRDYIAKHPLDEILENKDGISEAVYGKLKEKEEGLFLEIFTADVKDIILPGEIRDIMNTVLVAEKKAQANVIARREEVASTRSLLNTARLMEENPTLYKLKELEYVERICEKVGNLNVSSDSGLLASLGATLTGK